jgi:hypothetical protein
MGLESCGTAQVDDVLTFEFNMPEIKTPVRVSGKIQAKEASGRTSIEFIDASEFCRSAIREYIYGKITE